jgi:dTDP-4-dehydrorhamnose reductase
MRVVVVGAGGQLGAAVASEFGRASEVIGFTRATADITDAPALTAALARARPDVIVNCAAYNAVDAAEDHPVAALEVNSFAPRTLARAAHALGAALVQFGSDFVFDGEASQPYTELDTPNPRSAYAASKLLGDWFALDAPRSYVLRVESLFGGAAGGPAPKGTVHTLVEGLRAGRRVTVFNDRTVSPTYIPDAARATRALLERAAPPGLYHCVNSGCCTWREFAEEAARLLGVTPDLNAIRMQDVTMRAARPLYCAMSNQKLVDAGVAMPSWQDALGRYLSGLRAEG